MNNQKNMFPLLNQIFKKKDIAEIDTIIIPQHNINLLSEVYINL